MLKGEKKTSAVWLLSASFLNKDNAKVMLALDVSVGVVILSERGKEGTVVNETVSNKMLPCPNLLEAENIFSSFIFSYL